MRCLLPLILVLSTVSWQKSFAAEPDATDQARIQASWEMVSKTQKGVETKYDASSEEGSVDVTFEDRNWRAKLGNKSAPIEIAGTYFIDPSQTPKTLDLTIRGDKGSTDLYLIYKFERDALHLRLREGNGPRPVDFETPADDCIALVLRRKAS
jgi:uncharacterized protein (TIGR03067 family)